jgi:hypothetical protein
LRMPNGIGSPPCSGETAIAEVIESPMTRISRGTSPLPISRGSIVAPWGFHVNRGEFQRKQKRHFIKYKCF